ncbi:putative metal-binding motif-containing protein [Candidatus Woesearchaeota archaeon]|nr:putative metal-binding motif-containing protein [Candidatus Woesearchaeota archaeon]
MRKSAMFFLALIVAAMVISACKPTGKAFELNAAAQHNIKNFFLATGSSALTFYFNDGENAPTILAGEISKLAGHTGIQAFTGLGIFDPATIDNGILIITLDDSQGMASLPATAQSAVASVSINLPQGSVAISLIESGDLAADHNDNLIIVASSQAALMSFVSWAIGNTDDTLTYSAFGDQKSIIFDGTAHTISGAIQNCADGTPNGQCQAGANGNTGNRCVGGALGIDITNCPLSVITNPVQLVESNRDFPSGVKTRGDVITITLNVHRVILPPTGPKGYAIKEILPLGVVYRSSNIAPMGNGAQTAGGVSTLTWLVGMGDNNDKIITYDVELTQEGSLDFSGIVSYTRPETEASSPVIDEFSVSGSSQIAVSPPFNQVCTDDDGDGFGRAGTTLSQCPSTGADCHDNSDPTSGAANDFPGATEQCDGRDNNCDGAIDNLLSGFFSPCGISTGECETGTLACVAGSTVCQGGAHPSPETITPCDGKDNDCNGYNDDTLNCACTNGQTEVCGAGECSGQRTCSMGVYGPCLKPDGSDALSYSAEEICFDGNKDSDCDGSPNNGCTAIENEFTRILSAAPAQKGVLPVMGASGQDRNILINVNGKFRLTRALTASGSVATFCTQYASDLANAGTIISVGGPCANPVSESIFPFSGDCSASIADVSCEIKMVQNVQLCPGINKRFRQGKANYDRCWWIQC